MGPSKAPTPGPRFKLSIIILYFQSHYVNIFTSKHVHIVEHLWSFTAQT